MWSRSGTKRLKNPTAHIWSAPRLQRVNFRDVQERVSCKHISGLSLGALGSRALMGSAHTRLIKCAVSKTIALYRLLACRSDLSCHHFYFTPRNRRRMLPPKKILILRIPPGQLMGSAHTRLIKCHGLKDLRCTGSWHVGPPVLPSFLLHSAQP